MVAQGQHPETLGQPPKRQGGAQHASNFATCSSPLFPALPDKRVLTTGREGAAMQEGAGAVRLGQKEKVREQGRSRGAGGSPSGGRPAPSIVAENGAQS